MGGYKRMTNHELGSRSRSWRVSGGRSSRGGGASQDQKRTLKMETLIYSSRFWVVDMTP